MLSIRDEGRYMPSAYIHDGSMHSQGIITARWDHCSGKGTKSLYLWHFYHLPGIVFRLPYPFPPGDFPQDLEY